MNAPPFPLNPQVGEWSGNWVWNGARWVASPTTGFRLIRVVVAASGPYMPSPGLTSVDVECIGGGGGGGACGPITAVDILASGGGGGSGGRSLRALPAALVRGGVLVTVGAGGAGGQSGGPSGAPAGAGADGGSTSFGALCVANGGGGGAAFVPDGPGGDPGVGAAPGIGDLAFPGASGESGYFQEFASVASVSGAGAVGGSIVGGNATSQAGINGSVTGAAGAANTGAGGSGAVINQMAQGSEITGGAGGSGLCIVTEYCWGDRDQSLAEWSPPVNVNLNVTQRPPKPWPPGPLPPGWQPGWPPGWGPNPPWPPGWGPWPRGTLPQGQEFEAGAGAEPYSQDPEEDP